MYSRKKVCQGLLNKGTDMAFLPKVLELRPSKSWNHYFTNTFPHKYLLLTIIRGGVLG